MAAQLFVRCLCTRSALKEDTKTGLVHIDLAGPAHAELLHAGALAFLSGEAAHH